jgi:KaiC domain protein
MNGDRMSFGIEGLDRMMSGGLLKESICALIGTFGTGKTSFALQFVHEGLLRGERVLYISLEEREERIYKYIEERGWDPALYRNSGLTVLRLNPSDFNIAVDSIRNELFSLIEQLKPARIVIDPISLYEGLFESEGKRRMEIFRLTEELRDQHCTVLMTSETDKNDHYSSRHNMIEYLADTVVFLRYIRPSDFSEVHLAIEVTKMRESEHSREIKPYEILRDRILVHTEANVF